MIVVCWIIACALLVGILAVSEKLAPKFVPDSSGYIKFPFDSLEDSLSRSRTPGYPAVLGVTRIIDKDMLSIPFLSLLVHIAASVAFFFSLRRWNLSALPGLAAAFAVLFCVTLFDNVDQIATDALSLSLAVGTMAVLMILLTSSNRVWLCVLLSAMVFATVLVRPVYVSFVLLVPLATFFAARIERRTFVFAIKRALLLMAIVTTPLLCYCGMRKIVVGEFGIVSFIAFNQTGTTVQMLDDELVKELSGDSKSIALEIMERRNDYTLENPEWKQPPASYMEKQNRFDDTIYKVVVPVLQDEIDRDRVATHQRIGRMNQEIVLARPAHFIRWTLLAARQAFRVGAGDMIAHVPFLVAIFGAVCWVFVRFTFPNLAGRRVESRSTLVRIDESAWRGHQFLLCVAILFFVINVGIVCVFGAPFGRYVDAAAVFIPASIAAAVVSCLFSKCVS